MVIASVSWSGAASPCTGQGPTTEVHTSSTRAVSGSLEGPKVTPREPSEGSRARAPPW